MKIDYPQIDWADVQLGDTILAKVVLSELATSYVEFRHTEASDMQMEGASYFLVDRPRPVFPEDYGSIIIAKKVRGIEFPEGVVLTRLRGSHYEYVNYQPMWKSIDQRIAGKDNHGERMIEDWVLAKVVPA